MKKMRKIRLFQKDAYIGIDFLEKKAEVIKLKGDADEKTFSFDIETPAGKKTIAIATPPIPSINAIQKELESFIGSIRNQTRPVVSEMDGLLAMEVAHQILEKIAQNAVGH
jgi:hypothetical protein